MIISITSREDCTQLVGIDVSTASGSSAVTLIDPEQTVTIKHDGRAIATIKKGQVYVPCASCGDEASEPYCGRCADA